MATGRKFHEIYAEKMMKRNDYGYPFYEPASSLEVRPGRCGYIDQHGRWNPVTDLCVSAEELSARGLQPLKEVPEKAPDDKGIEWGPKYSESVTGRRVDLKAGVSAEALGVPASASCVYQFSSSSNFGAMLMTEPNIWREGFYHDSQFEAWVKQNNAALFAIRPEIKEHGLWVVKWIYSTTKCSLNAWTSKEKVLTVGFKTNAIAIGEAAPQGSWYESNIDGGWSQYTAKEGERKVVFMGGLYFQWRRLARSGNNLQRSEPDRPKWIFRSSEGDKTSQINVDGEEYELTIEGVGRMENDQEADENEIF